MRNDGLIYGSWSHTHWVCSKCSQESNRDKTLEKATHLLGSIYSFGMISFDEHFRNAHGYNPSAWRVEVETKQGNFVPRILSYSSLRSDRDRKRPWLGLAPESGWLQINNVREGGRTIGFISSTLIAKNYYAPALNSFRKQNDGAWKINGT